MNKNFKLISIGVALIFALALFFVLKWDSSVNDESDASFVSNNWSERYGLESKHPFGLHLFFHLVKLKNPKQRIVQISTKYQYDSIIKLKEKATFYMIADTVGLMPKESERLQERLLEGSSLLLSASLFSEKLLDTFNVRLKPAFVYEKSVKFHFNADTVRFHSIFQNDTIYDEWYGFKKVLNESEYPVSDLIRFQNLSSLLKLKLPESTVLIHSNPTTLQNINAKSKNAFKYINFILNQLPTKQTIYFVDFARVQNKGEEEEQIEPENNLMQLIYENRILLNSMMLLFFTGLLFVIFRTKRRREVVPVIPQEVNITKAFAETIGSIYLNKQNPSSILALQRKNFFDTVYRYYYVDLSKKREETSIKSLAEKTNYDFNELNHLISHLDAENKEVGNDYIIKLAKLQHDFYKHCGIIEDKIETKVQSFEVSRNMWISSFFLTVGFLAFLTGLYLLTKSNAAGVIIWIAGFLLLVYGVLRFLRPHLSIQKNQVTYFNSFGFPTIYSFDKIKSMEVQQASIQIITKTKTIQIPLFDTLKIDVSQLKRFIHLTKFYDN